MSERERPDDDATAGDGTIRAEFDWAAVSPSTGVVEAVAIASDREPLSLEPLYETIDPDALDALLRSYGATSTDGVVTVTFSVAGQPVRVQSDGVVVVRPEETRAELAE